MSLTTTVFLDKENRGELFLVAPTSPARLVEDERLRAVAGLRDMLGTLGRDGLSPPPLILQRLERAEALRWSVT